MSHARAIRCLALVALLALSAQATTRGAPVEVTCPIDGHRMTIRPIKSRVVPPFPADGHGVHPPELHSCSSCGYVGDASEWMSHRVLTTWERLSVAVWLVEVGRELGLVQRWAALARELELPAAQRGIRHLMAATAHVTHAAEHRRQAERAFSSGTDAWSRYFTAELRRQRGESVREPMRRLSEDRSAPSTIRRWAHERASHGSD